MKSYRLVTAPEGKCLTLWAPRGMKGQGAIDRNREAMQTQTDNLRGNAAGTMPVGWVCLQGPMNNSPQRATRSEVPVRVFHALNGYRDLNELWRALRLTLRPRLGSTL